MEKILSVMKLLYPGYLFVFIFNNATSYSVYTKNVLCANKMNKRPGGQQVILHNS